jgi:ketol-acid reductoisomerase
MTRIYETASIDALIGKPITLIGYGSQGRAHALNLRDSGLDVRLGLRQGGKTWKQALEDGWQPLSITEALKGADLIALLTPDMSQKILFEEYIQPAIEPGALLLFAHGFNIHYGQIDPDTHIDIALVAPKGPGALVRSQYEEGRGVPCLLAIHQDASGTAEARGLAYAAGIGGGRAGILGTTFAEETETDLFGEQAVICGGVTALITAGWETLVDAGYSPEVAYFECLHEMKLIVDLLHEGGLQRMPHFISETASFGDLTRGRRIIDESARERMRQVLAEIQSGAFATQWIDEDLAGAPRYNSLLTGDLAHPIEETGAHLRARMPWLNQPKAPEAK